MSFVRTFYGEERDQKFLGKLCAPKEQGGLGMYSLINLNTSFGIRQVWNSLNKDNVWSNWLKKRYLGNTNFWDAVCSYSQSGVWKRILNSRMKVLEVFQRRVVNGQSINIWFDSWINGSSLLNRHGMQSRINLVGANLLVSSIIRDGNCFPENLLQTQSLSIEFKGIKINNNLGRLLGWQIQSWWFFSFQGLHEVFTT